MCIFPLLFVVALGATHATEPAEPVRVELAYAPSPPDNPLMGLVPYAGEHRERFPHSMEFGYLPLSALVTGPEQFDWTALEKLLNNVAERGHQTVFRIFLEYPGKEVGIPQFLIDQGLRIHRYRVGNDSVITPDYKNEKLRATLQSFIAALGKRYDGDPRIGYITAGLLGHWGEWHTHPRPELFADKTVQEEVMAAYETAFKQTPILLRYPAGHDDAKFVANAGRQFGYHDDSFGWGTLDTGRKQDSWFFVPLLRRAGAEEQWKQQPIGGEIRPEAWGHIFDAPPTDLPADTKLQSFRDCVYQTHASWLMDSGMFKKSQPDGRRARAIELVRQLGYSLHVPWVAVDGPANGRIELQIAVVNRGVAPFYRDWPAELGLLSGDGKLVQMTPAKGRIHDLLPDTKAQVWRESLDVARLSAGKHVLGLRVANPLPKGHPIRFANESQDADADGWLSLTSITIP